MFIAGCVGINCIVGFSITLTGKKGTPCAGVPVGGVHSVSSRPQTADNRTATALWNAICPSPGAAVCAAIPNDQPIPRNHPA